MLSFPMLKLMNYFKYVRQMPNRDGLYYCYYDVNVAYISYMK